MVLDVHWVFIDLLLDVHLIFMAFVEAFGCASLTQDVYGMVFLVHWMFIAFLSDVHGTFIRLLHLFLDVLIWCSSIGCSLYWMSN